MSKTSSIIEILRQFPEVRCQQADCLGNAGGFSGACLWRIKTPVTDFCLRRWPKAHPSEQGLRLVHNLLRHAHSLGMTEFPAPLLHVGNDTVLRHRNFLYELTPWMLGSADFHANPNSQRLTAAMTVVARFHEAIRTYPERADETGPASSPSPGLVERRAKLDWIRKGAIDRLAIAVNAHHDAEVRQRAQNIIRLFSSRSAAVEKLVVRAAALEVRQQYCIRDIWHDHVLFTGDEVTGVIDFGAMRRDNIACDLARLIGSLVGDNPAEWTHALRAYEKVQPLTADEHLLIRAFDQSGVLMSGLSWLQWICVEGKQFEDQQRVLTRLDENLTRLEYMPASE